MSTAARKERKRAGEKFVRAPKVGTPVQERAWFNATVPGAKGTRNEGRHASRSQKKRGRVLEARGIEVSE